MKSIFLANISILLIWSSAITAIDASIFLHLEKYPYFKQHSHKKDQFDEKKYSKELAQPNYVYRTMTEASKQFDQALPGVLAIYDGHIALSDSNGYLTFSKRQQTPDMYLLVAKSIKPAYMIAPATVHHWILDTSQPYELYFAKYNHDAKTTLSYYEVSKIEPKDHSIHLNTIIIIADPSSVYIPVGATIINYSSNIVLPTIYLKRNFCFIYNSLYSLAIKQYFRQVDTSIKQENLNIIMLPQT